LLKKISTGFDGDGDLVALNRREYVQGCQQYTGDTDLGPNGIAFDEVPVQQFGYVDNGELAPLHNRLPGKMDLLRTIHVHDKKRKVGWPTSGEKAVSNTQTKYFFLQGISWLFPGGFGDLREAQNGRVGSRMLSLGRRFLRDPVCLSMQNNYITRQNSSTGKWFVDTFQNNAPETLEDLKTS
jgi:hypothetical protein